MTCITTRLATLLQVHAMDLTLEVGAHANMDLQPLLDKIPNLSADWDAIAARPIHGISPFRRVVPAVELYKFLVVRCKFSRMPFEHPFSLLRRALVHVLAWLIEVQVQMSIADVDATFGKRAPPVAQLFGPTQRQKSHHLPLPKLLAMKQCEEVHGSRETILRTSGLHKGSSSQLRSAKLAIYKEQAAAGFSSSNCFWLNHDGSCHGGASMIVGVGFDSVLNVGAYVKPEAILVIIKGKPAENYSQIGVVAQSYV